MDAPRTRRPRPPLDERSLDELALAYVGRFATTRAKLRSYLSRKLRERGWGGERDPDPAALAQRFADQGYIDDAGFAISKARALTSRGYGKRRVVEKLRVAGVEESDAAAARELSDGEAVASALRFAERRRIGPFAIGGEPDPQQRQRAIAAMVRAGHGFAIARAIAAMRPGAAIDPEDLAERARVNGN